MSRMLTFPALVAALSLLALPAAQASVSPEADLLSFAPTVMAKHGADDPAGDDRGGKGRGRDDGPNHAWVPGSTLILAKHGADDPAGDNRGGKGRGGDDGANHT